MINHYSIGDSFDIHQDFYFPNQIYNIVVTLSDEYEGGELQTFTQPEPQAVDKKRGLIAAFPSWALHRVTPVTSGVRRTLVVWVAGPQFK